MTKFKKKASLSAFIAAFGGAVITTTAQAEILQYEFTNPTGEVVKQAAEQKFLNETSGIKVAVNAGIERKIRLTVYSSGEQVTQQLSDKIGATDRITVRGQSYYGEYLNIPSLAEGDYTVKTEILSSSGDVVSTYENPLTIDRTAPDFNVSATGHNYYGVTVTEGDVWKMATMNDYPRLVIVDQINEAHPIQNAEVDVYGEDGSYIHTRPLAYDADSGQATRRYNRTGYLFPKSDLDEEFTLHFKVTDAAGNIAVKKQKAYWDDTGVKPNEPYALGNTSWTGNKEHPVPGLEGYEPYNSGMTGYENPLTLVYKFKKRDYKTYREGGTDIYNSLGTVKEIATDQEHTYIEVVVPYGQTNSNNIRFRNWGSWGGAGHINYNINLSEEAPKSPKFLDQEYLWSDIGWGGDRRKPSNTELPIAVTKTRITVEERPYQQEVYKAGVGTCELMPYETVCEIDINNLNLDNGTGGYWKSGVIVSNAEGTLKTDYYHSDVTWNDRWYPEIESERNDNIVTLFINQPNQNAFSNRIMFENAWLYDGDNQLPINGTKTGQANTRFTYEFDLNELPEGSYSLKAVAKESLGPTTELPLFEYVSDRTPPNLTISIPNGGEISSLDDISIRIADAIDNDPSITSIRMTGGPGNEDVGLAWRHQSGAEYALEYPVMFPSLEEGESYNIVVTTKDASGNEATESQSFAYVPSVVDVGGEESFVQLPHIYESVTRADGMNALYSAPLTLGDGSTIGGTYSVYATMRADAEVPLVINGQLVRPGETVDIADAYNFGANDSRFNFTVHPVQGSTPGKSSVLLGSSAPNAPILVADIVTVPMESVTTFEVNEPRQVIDPMNLSVAPKAGAAYCDLTVSRTKALNADPFKNPMCLVEFNAPGMNVRTFDGGGKVHLNGFARGTGEHVIDYTVTLLGHNDSEHVLAQDSATVNVLSAMNALELDVTNDISEAQKYVEQVSTVLQMRRGLGCDLTSSRNEAIKFAIDKVSDSIKPKCLVEWENIPQGLSLFNNSLGVRGYFDEAGVQPLSWRVSLFYEGEQQLTLATQSYDIDVTEPVEPQVLATTITYTDGRSSSGSSHLLRDPSVGIESVEFEVTEQVYPQIIRAGNQETCEVAVGRSRCRVSFETETFGNRADVPQGSFDIPFQVEAGDGRAYFEQRDMGASLHRLDWDYTPPTVDQVVINPSVDGTTIPVTVDTQTMQVEGDKVLLVLNTPFTFLPGTDWHLDDPALIVNTDTDVRMEQMVMVDDERFFFSHNRQDMTRDNRIMPSDVSVIGQSLVYEYDISALTDGAFTFDVDVRDAYGNGDWHHQDTFMLQRTEPKLRLAYLRKDGSHINTFFFANEFGAVASPGWDNDNEIISAAFGGVPLALEDDPQAPRPNVKFFGGDVSELTPGQDYELVVRAKDTAGNIGEIKQTLTYAPNFFNLSSDAREDTVYRSVQRVTTMVTQRRRNCTLTSSKELAQSVSIPQRKGCYIRLEKLPSNMTPEFQGWGARLVGSIVSADDNEVVARGYLVNSDGHQVGMEPMSLSWELKEPDPLDMTFNGSIKLADGVYGIYPMSGLIGNYMVDNVSGELNMITRLGDDVDEELHGQRGSGQYRISNMLRDMNANAREVFERHPLTMEATYTYAPEFAISKNVEVITLPSKRTTAMLNLINEGDIYSTDELQFRVSVGNWSRTGDSDYNRRTMGDWTVSLAYEKDGEKHTFVEPKDINEQGYALFDVPAEMVYGESRSVYAIAESQSPHPEYQKTLTSTPMFMQILLGSQIDGELSARRLTGPAPFMVIARYDFDTLDHRLASTDIRWEVSTDKSNWSALTEFEGRDIIPFKMEEAGDYYLRAHAKNQYTGEESTTQILHVAAYDRPRLRINGSRFAYKEQPISMSMFDYDEPLSSEDGIAEWSTDGGETWIEGEPTQSFIAGDEKRQEYIGRFRLHTTSDIVDDEGWSVTRHYVSHVEPRPAYVQIRTQPLIELDVPFTLTALPRNMNGGVDLPMEVQWTLPDGTTQTGNEIEYTGSSDELDETGKLPIKATAWVEGYKSQTTGTKERKLRTWEYKLPEAEIDLRSSIMVAPSRMSAKVNYRRTFMPGIEHTFEWLPNPAFEYNNPDSVGTQLLVKEPGVHEVKVRMSDSRGNSQVISQFVDVLEPEPFEGSFMKYSSNQYNRAPVGLIVRAKAEGGHPRDYIEQYEWYVNGELQANDAPRSPMARFELTEPGTHEIKVVGRSKYGQELEMTEVHRVVANQEPTCEATKYETDRMYRLVLKCEDNDGYMSNYHWWLNGEYIGRGSSSIYAYKSQYESLSLKYEAFDDAGASVTGEASW